MARPLRLQFPGAVYHVLNRGNYRRDLFASAGARASFRLTFHQACERFRWQVHAFVIMSNHFHFALETPEPNLALGMHWLLGTFATRFNRFRSEQGHLFQGRYRALPVEDTNALQAVVDYIHLNPVRAGVVAPGDLLRFSDSSLTVCLDEARPAWLVTTRRLAALDLRDDPSGWCRYAAHLARLAQDQEQQEALDFPRISRGWAVGTAAWRRTLARDGTRKNLRAGLDANILEDCREADWLRTWVAITAARGGEAAVADLPLKTKIAVAAELRRRVAAPYAWIARMLRLPSAASLRMQVHRCRLQVAP